MTNERPACLAPGSVFVWAGVACLGLMWSDKPVWPPGVTRATLMTNQRPVWGTLTNQQAAIWDGQSGTMCGTLYRSSIIIFMMCQNFYNSEKNIVLITRQSEYFIICYLYKSLFHYYATGIRYLHWNICCIITTLCWWIILVMLSSLMRWWSWWQQNGGEEPSSAHFSHGPGVTPADWNRFLKNSFLPGSHVSVTSIITSPSGMKWPHHNPIMISLL